MTNKPAKYIITIGPFDGQTNNIKQARKELDKHVRKMFEIYGSRDTYSIYMLIESKSIKDCKQ